MDSQDLKSSPTPPTASASEKASVPDASQPRESSQSITPEVMPLAPPPALMRTFQAFKELVHIDHVYTNIDIEPVLIHVSKLKEILNEEVPPTPPAHDWYGFLATAVGLGVTLVTPPFTDPAWVELWRVVGAGVIVWLFMKSLTAHKMNKSLKRNKAAIVTSILKKVKNEKQ